MSLRFVKRYRSKNRLGRSQFADGIFTHCGVYRDCFRIMARAEVIGQVPADCQQSIQKVKITIALSGSESGCHIFWPEPQS
jgi:hypothetical protein